MLNVVYLFCVNVCVMTVAKLKCKCHGEYQPREKLIATPKGKFCSYALAIEWANEQTKKRIKQENKKIKKVRAKEIRVNKKAITELNRRTLSWQHKQRKKYLIS